MSNLAKYEVKEDSQILDEMIVRSQFNQWHIETVKPPYAWLNVRKVRCYVIPELWGAIVIEKPEGQYEFEGEKFGSPDHKWITYVIWVGDPSIGKVGACKQFETQGEAQRFAISQLDMKSYKSK